MQRCLLREEGIMSEDAPKPPYYCCGYDKEDLILQPHLAFASVVVCAPGTGLMASTPP
jgi:hypothetical protein